MSMRGDTLFDLNGRRIGLRYQMALHAMRLMQVVLTGLDVLVLHHLIALLLRRKGISYHLFLHSKGGYRKADKFFKQISNIIRNAKEVRIAVGEMGYRLMERDELIDSLLHAHRECNAVITVAHGPRVDPKTQRMFRLAETSIVTLHRMTYYEPHHFILITDQTGELTVLDEAVHDETIWARNQYGQGHQLFASMARRYFLIKGVPEYVSALEAEFNRRISNSEVIYTHPGLSAPQTYSIVDTLRSTLLGVPIGRIRQLVAIYGDQPVDLLATNVYKAPTTMFLPEGYRHLPVEYIELSTTLDDIPEGPRCLICGQQTQKAYVPFSCGQEVIFYVERAPGYRCVSDVCAEDPPEYQSVSVVLEVLGRAKAIMLERGNIAAAQDLEQDLEHHRKVAAG